MPRRREGEGKNDRIGDHQVLVTWNARFGTPVLPVRGSAREALAKTKGEIQQSNTERRHLQQHPGEIQYDRE